MNTDSFNLDLRRRVIHAAGFKKLRVLDLFAGAGELWGQIGEDFTVESYVAGVGKPPRSEPASLPLLIEAIGRMRINVIEIELAGDPWELWAAATKRIVQQTAIFVTLPGAGSRPASKFTREALGIPAAWEVPTEAGLVEFAARYFLVPRLNGTEIRAIWRAFDGKVTTFAALARPAQA